MRTNHAAGRQRHRLYRLPKVSVQHRSSGSRHLIVTRISIRHIQLSQMTTWTFCQVDWSDSGSTRVSPIVVMKFVSPSQRGNTCPCRCLGIPGASGLAQVHADVHAVGAVGGLEGLDRLADHQEVVLVLGVAEFLDRRRRDAGAGSRVTRPVREGVQDDEAQVAPWR